MQAIGVFHDVAVEIPGLRLFVRSRRRGCLAKLRGWVPHLHTHNYP